MSTVVSCQTSRVLLTELQHNSSVNPDETITPLNCDTVFDYSLIWLGALLEVFRVDPIILWHLDIDDLYASEEWDVSLRNRALPSSELLLTKGISISSASLFFD
jgi:hypothetical protein